MAFQGVVCSFLDVSVLCHWNYGGFSTFASELRITELSNLTLKNTEVSVIFTYGWQHCPPMSIQGDYPIQVVLKSSGLNTKHFIHFQDQLLQELRLSNLRSLLLQGR